MLKWHVNKEVTLIRWHDKWHMCLWDIGDKKMHNHDVLGSELHNRDILWLKLHTSLCLGFSILFYFINFLFIFIIIKLKTSNFKIVLKYK